MINLSESGITVYSSTAAGAFYGATTIDILTRQFTSGLPAGVIADKPAWRHRGAQVSYAQMNVDYRDKYLRDFIRSMADIKVNTVYLYLEWRYQFPSIPALHNPAYISPEQARDIQRYAAAYNITIVPALNVLGHTGDFLAMQAFHDLGEYDSSAQDARVDESSTLCTSNPRTRGIISKALNDIMDAFDSEIIHVGGDEVSALGVCPRCKAAYGGMSRARIYIDYMCWVRDILKARGRRMGIWSDMLIDFLANGNKAVVEQMQRLLDHSVIFDWRYDSAHTEAIETLGRMNVDMILSTSVHGCSVGSPCLNQHINQRDYFSDGFRFKIRGGLVTDWIYGHGYHGAQIGMLYASAEALMWQGVGDEFARGTSFDQFLLDYAMQTFGIGAPLIAYWRLAGDAQGELLRHYSAGRSGSYMRRSAYLDDSPLGSFIHYASDINAASLAEISACVNRLDALWNEISSAARTQPFLPFMKCSLVLNRYLLRKLRWGFELYETYDRAAHIQYSDPDEFAAIMRRAAHRLRSYGDAFDEPIAYLTEARSQLGLEGGSIARLMNTKKNLALLADFIEHLSDSHRPLPAFRNMNSYLFARPLTNFWAPRSDEWYGEAAPFTRTDGDNGGEWGAAH